MALRHTHDGIAAETASGGGGEKKTDRCASDQRCGSRSGIARVRRGRTSWSKRAKKARAKKSERGMCTQVVDGRDRS